MCIPVVGHVYSKVTLNITTLICTSCELVIKITLAGEFKQKAECITWHGSVVFAKYLVFRFVGIEKVRNIV